MFETYTIGISFFAIINIRRFMYIRILGNSASGKTTLARKLGEFNQYPVLHLDTIAFKENSNFVRKPEKQILESYVQFCRKHENIIVDGTYLDITTRFPLVPDLIIMIDLPIEQSLYNFQTRYQKYLGKSRSELPGLIESNSSAMVEWISNFPTRAPLMYEQINLYQLQSLGLNVVILNDMPEVIALCNNPQFLENLF